MSNANSVLSSQKRMFPDQGGVLVVGGSGGLGSAIVTAMAGYGCNVAFTFNSRREPAEAMAKGLQAQGRQAITYPMSLTDRASIVETVEAAAQALGGLHTLIYAAGAVLYLRYIAEIEHERMAYHVESDVMGYFNLVQAALPHLRRARGSVVACCSCGVEKWPIKDALSVVPKSAITALTVGLAREEGRCGIRANVIGTGVIDAGVTKTGQAAGDVPESFIAGAMKSTPLGRLGEAEDIAEAAAYLASGRAKFVTGQVLNVDGGWSI